MKVRTCSLMRLNYKFSYSKPLLLFLYLSLSLNVSSAENPYNNEEMYKQLDAWKAPSALSRNFTYYLAGYDYVDRPVWVIEWGKWNFKNLLEFESQEMVDQFDKYAEQALFRMHKSPHKFPKRYTTQGNDDNDNNAWVLIVDMEGYSVDQLANKKASQMGVTLASKLSIAGENMEYGLIINANYVANRFFNVIRPVLGHTYSKLETYGTRREVWKPKILKKMPRDQVPEFYGGSKNFKPVAVFG